jgi:hypothetical protein
MLKFARSFGAAFALVLLGAVFALAVPTALPLPSTPGPFLGDFGNNLYTITQNYLAGSGHGATNLGSVSQTATQAACTQIGVSGQNDSTLYQVTTSAGTGSVCLPTAIAGRIVYVTNATGQTIDLFSNVVSYTSGTADTINTSAGTGAYTGLTTHKMAVCVAAVNGAWFCGSVS